MKTITLDGNHWFALKVFYNKVFEIEESLKKDDIDCYFPCEDAVVMRNGVRKIIRKPIISSILFFHSTTLRAMEIQRQFTDKVILYTRDKGIEKGATYHSGPGDEYFHVGHVIRRERNGIFGG